ncbi:unnamed protein product [Notodromas monacha]|uniref:Queuine tRNA-ribosyltransferase catalytic subunit 1 n=1 Tax=Notodromas monacha TaxID=399045 RepID=A0A7R9BMY1_9CRUS|nr:unnamed protein product [Notodromas monacha]CAG0917085.1 unnamed protein product [Notodromas monacha]
MMPTKHPLTFSVIAECARTKARTAILTLPHATLETPVFMPVGTKGTMKGLLPEQLEDLNCRMMLSNTYHLGTNPGPDLLDKAKGLHSFMHWRNGLLTDSGGFQMVSLLKLARITEEGVTFKSPYDDSECLLTPERSIEIQNSIGADIIMQLDDVVSSTLQDRNRVEEAMHRPVTLTIRWLDRCLKAHKKPEKQCIFPIVQGGLFSDLREECAKSLLLRDVAGYAIGGLSGGEEKADFWRMVTLSTGILPRDKPRYLMGVGVAADLVVCVALGVDMFDCVFPTRTARFGSALVDSGNLYLKHKRFAKDFSPIDPECECSTCKRHTRAFLHSVVTVEASACHLLSVHNIAYQVSFSQFFMSCWEVRFFLSLQRGSLKNNAGSSSYASITCYVVKGRH